MALRLCRLTVGRVQGLFGSLQHVQHHPEHVFVRPISSEQTVAVTEKDGVRRIEIQQPKTRNALSHSVLEQLGNELHNCPESTRVVVLKADGPVFSSGHNLRELTMSNSKSSVQRIFELCSQVMLLIRDLPLPVIGQVNGLATAAGCQLACSCDILLCSDKAAFQVPGVSIGLFCSTPGIALARSVPQKVAMEMLFTGRFLTAQEALQHGLVSRVVPNDQLDNEVESVAQQISSHSKSVLALGKQFFYRQITQDLPSAYRDGEKVMVNNLELVDAQEGLSAFLNKRKATWSHTDERTEFIPSDHVGPS